MRHLINDKENKDIPFPGWDKLDAELNEKPTKIVLEIRDEKGDFVDRITGSNKKGLNRVAWSLNKPIVTTIRTDNSFGGYRLSVPVSPGVYSATLMEYKEGKYSALAESKNFNVKRIREGVLKNPNESKKESLIQDFVEFDVDYNKLNLKFDIAK